MIARRPVLVGLIAAPVVLAYGRAGALASEPLFTLGVASGDPHSDGFVIWTRLAPRPLSGDGGMPPVRVPVRWEIYSDDAGRVLLHKGEAIADPAWGHSVHVEVSGLPSGRAYWFRFFAQGQSSPIGRTRTAPASHEMADRLRFVFGSCQKYEVGHYGAWAHAVADDPDLIVFLGDYIYEGKPKSDGVRMHLNPEPMDLEGYRVRYATYRLDPLLQAAHAVAPWVVTWDDHEVANNYGGLLDEMNTDPVSFERRRAAAYQAYWEFMPLRRKARPHGSSMRLYRTVDWGPLAQFQVVDDRQYRSDRVCQPAGSVEAHQRSVDLVRDCAERHDPARSMLGHAQERWLDGALGRTRARWNFLAQQTQMARYPQFGGDPAATIPEMHSNDSWEGYPAARDRLIERWLSAKVSNPLAIGGDIHSFTASDLRLGDRPDGRIVAPCMVGGSITSLNPDTTLERTAALTGQFHYARNTVRGYGRADVFAGRCEVTFRAMADATNPATSAYDAAQFEIEAGRPEIRTRSIV